MIDFGEKRNDISELTNISEYKYENLFQVYSLSSYYFYNILNRVTFPSDIDGDFFDYYTVDKSLPWTIISYNVYNTIDLWWLICALNGIENPVAFPERGTQLKMLKPIYVREVIDQING